MKDSKLPKKKPSALQKEHPTLQNTKIISYFGIILVLLSPDPRTLSNPFPSPFSYTPRVVSVDPDWFFHNRIRYMSSL